MGSRVCAPSPPPCCRRCPLLGWPLRPRLPPRLHGRFYREGGGPRQVNSGLAQLLFWFSRVPAELGRRARGKDTWVLRPERVTRGALGARWPIMGRGSPLYPPPRPNLTFPSARGVRWAGCPHRRGVSHSRWRAHPLPGAGPEAGTGPCGFGRPLSVGVWLSFPAPLSLQLPASPLTGLRTLQLRGTGWGAGSHTSASRSQDRALSALLLAGCQVLSPFFLCL